LYGALLLRRSAHDLTFSENRLCCGILQNKNNVTHCVRQVDIYRICTESLPIYALRSFTIVFTDARHFLPCSLSPFSLVHFSLLEDTL
jgi:hypothetical protein